MSPVNVNVWLVPCEVCEGCPVINTVTFGVDGALATVTRNVAPVHTIPVAAKYVILIGVTGAGVATVAVNALV